MAPFTAGCWSKLKLRRSNRSTSCWAPGVLHHLDDDTARQFMSVASAALKPGGRIYTVDPCYAPGQSPIARFLISRDRGQHVRDVEGYRALPRGLAAEVTGTLVHRAWIPYTRWHMECRMSAAGTPSCAKGAMGDRIEETHSARARHPATKDPANLPVGPGDSGLDLRRTVVAVAGPPQPRRVLVRAFLAVVAAGQGPGHRSARRESPDGVGVVHAVGRARAVEPAGRAIRRASGLLGIFSHQHRVVDRRVVTAGERGSALPRWDG